MSNIDYSQIGIAGLTSDAFTQVELLAGDTPAIVTDYGILGADLAVTGIAAWTPVIVDPATRAITLPVAGVSKANALTVAGLPAGAAATANVPVYKAGTFNVEAIRFGADFDTDAEKFSAFNLAQCQIYVKAPYYA